MSENGESSGRRDRSPAYPLMPLEEALERLAEFEIHFKRTSVTLDRVGAAWSIKSRAHSSRIAAALRYFGLFDYQESEGDRRIVISEQGRKYLLAQQDDIRREVVKTAALCPRAIATFWNLWGEDRPSDASCLDQMMFEHSFSGSGARKFLKVYDATISFAGLSKSDRDDPPEDLAGSVGNTPEDDSADDFERKYPQRPCLPRIHRQEGTGMKEDVFTLDEGDVVLQWPATLSSASYADLKDWLDLMLRKIERQAPADDENAEPAADD